MALPSADRHKPEFDGAMLAEEAKWIQNYQRMEIYEGQASLLFNVDFTENLFVTGNERSEPTAGSVANT